MLIYFTYSPLRLHKTNPLISYKIVSDCIHSKTQREFRIKKRKKKSQSPGRKKKRLASCFMRFKHVLRLKHIVFWQNTSALSKSNYNVLYLCSIHWFFADYLCPTITIIGQNNSQFVYNRNAIRVVNNFFRSLKSI